MENLAATQGTPRPLNLPHGALVLHPSDSRHLNTISVDSDGGAIRTDSSVARRDRHVVPGHVQRVIQPPSNRNPTDANRTNAATGDAEKNTGSESAVDAVLSPEHRILVDELSEISHHTMLIETPLPGNIVLSDGTELNNGAGWTTFGGEWAQKQIKRTGTQLHVARDRQSVLRILPGEGVGVTHTGEASHGPEAVQFRLEPNRGATPRDEELVRVVYEYNNDSARKDGRQLTNDRIFDHTGRVQTIYMSTVLTESMAQDLLAATKEDPDVTREYFYACAKHIGAPEWNKETYERTYYESESSWKRAGVPPPNGALAPDHMKLEVFDNINNA